MNAKLTPGLLIIALVIAGLAGPLALLKDITPEQMTDLAYWEMVGASAIASLASGALALIALVSTALGLPLLSARFRGGDSP